MPAKKTPSKPAARKTTAAKTTAAKSATAKAAAAKSAATKSAATKSAATKSTTKAAPAAVARIPAKTPAKTPAEKPAAQLALAVAQPVEAAVAASQETMEAVVKAGNQAATKGYEQAVAITQEQVEKASSTLFQGYEDVASLGKDSVGACVASSALLAKGVEAMSKQMMNLAQTTVESNLATAMAFFGAQSLQEAIDLQTDLSRSRLDTMVAESAKLTELSLALANDSLAPLQAQLNANVEKLMKPLAA